ncbi:YpmS family protein [Evansella tamaricis]|uniref:YpmS family protein n=1 Tax=Evansella tamaricis TaxID=2069301 RepID=A0ABS6JG27_9BACI|nr:YpmS family protein [Evansella tamaricis]
MITNEINKWKVAFISLLGLIGLSAILLFSWVILLSTTDYHIPQNIDSNMDGARFTVTTSKDDINLWIERELEKDGMGSEFRLYLQDHVYFQTIINAFGHQVPLEIVLHPHVTENGNLELLERSFSIGNLVLPSETVFRILAATVTLPDWIYIIPQEGKLYLNLVDGISDEIAITIQQLDLEKDLIEIELIFK